MAEFRIGGTSDFSAKASKLLDSNFSWCHMWPKKSSQVRERSPLLPSSCQGIWGWVTWAIWAALRCLGPWEGEQGWSGITVFPFLLPRAPPPPPMAQGWKLLKQGVFPGMKVKALLPFSPVVFSNDSQFQGTRRPAFSCWIQIIWQTFLAYKWVIPDNYSLLVLQPSLSVKHYFHTYWNIWNKFVVVL